jgi:hypothetical protein
LGRPKAGPEPRNHDRKVLPGKIGPRKNFTSENEASNGDKNSLEENFMVGENEKQIQRGNQGHTNRCSSWDSTEAVQPIGRCKTDLVLRTRPATKIKK